MNLKYKTKNKSNEDKEVRVTFDPPLSSYEEVKPRLLSMTADAQEALGMVSKITLLNTTHHFYIFIALKLKLTDI